MAEHQLAHRHERKAQSALCRHPCAHRRRTTTANQGQGPATSARGGSLAHRRTQGVGREEIQSRQPAGKDRPAHLGGYHQGAMDLRTGSPTAEGRTRSRSLRGTILARPSPPCAHDDDGVRLPPASPPCNCKAGKKESTGHRPSRPCQPCATPSSNSSLDHRRSDARIAENGFATSSGGSKSAKVVLAAVASLRIAITSAEYRPCFQFALRLRARPSAVRGPALAPLCIPAPAVWSINQRSGRSWISMNEEAELRYWGSCRESREMPVRQAS